MSNCCPQSDLFLDMLGLRLAIVALSLSFSGHAGAEVNNYCCPQSDLFLDMLGLR